MAVMAHTATLREGRSDGAQKMLAPQAPRKGGITTRTLTLLCQSPNNSTESSALQSSLSQILKKEKEMTEEKQDKEQEQRMLPFGAERIRTLFLETVEPLAEDLNAKEVLFFAEKAFDVGFESLALRSEGVQEGILFAQNQQMRMQQMFAAQMESQQKGQPHVAGSVPDSSQPDEDVSSGLYL